MVIVSFLCAFGSCGKSLEAGPISGKISDKAFPALLEEAQENQYGDQNYQRVISILRSSREGQKY